MYWTNINKKYVYQHFHILCHVLLIYFQSINLYNLMSFQCKRHTTSLVIDNWIFQLPTILDMLQVFFFTEIIMYICAFISIVKSQRPAAIRCFTNYNCHTNVQKVRNKSILELDSDTLFSKFLLWIFFVFDTYEPYVSKMY